jgi:hypothetical protein
MAGGLYGGIKFSGSTSGIGSSEATIITPIEPSTTAANVQPVQVAADVPAPAANDPTPPKQDDSQKKAAGEQRILVINMSVWLNPAYRLVCGALVRTDSAKGASYSIQAYVLWLHHRKRLCRHSGSEHQFLCCYFRPARYNSADKGQTRCAIRGRRQQQRRWLVEENQSPLHGT